MNSMVSWYQCKIGAYDLQIWERAVEIQEQQDGGMKSMDKRSSSVRPDLIDIDLVRGSTFSKNKPQYSWFVVTGKALIRIICLPLFYKWWVQQSSQAITILILSLYFLHGAASYLYITGSEDQFKNLSTTEVFMPILLMFIVGSVHCHVVSTNFRPHLRVDSHRRKQKRTLSSALLEPVESSSHQTALSFIRSSVKEVGHNEAGSLSKMDDGRKNSDILSEACDRDIADKQSHVVIGRRKISVEPATENVLTEANSEMKENILKELNGIEDPVVTSKIELTESELYNHEKELKNVQQTAESEQLFDEFHSTSSGSDDSSCLSDESDCNNSNSDESCITDKKKKQPKNLSATALLPSPGVDKISVKIWESNQCKKVQASLLEIGSIIRRKVQKTPMTSDIFSIALCFSFSIACIPMLFRTFTNEYIKPPYEGSLELLSKVCTKFSNNIYVVVEDVFVMLHGENPGISAIFIVYAVMLERFILSWMFFFMLCAAQRTFRQRFLFAKYFSHLTSSRRAKKSDLPHFRLDRVENVRLWLSLRSYLRRRGPQRSVDVIVSSAFFLSLCLLCFITIQLLHDTDLFLSSMLYWEMTVWLLALAVFILNFMTLGAQINKKYSNISVLLTEQINLYLQMKQKPQKKEELQLANSVLSLAVKLIKEIETPFQIYGLEMNPLLYNITRVVVLSAFSGVVSEILGFKLKIWKIKP